MEQERDKKIDWTKLELEYVTTNISYEGLSKKYNIRKNTIADHGRKNAWREKRVQNRHETVTAAARKTAKKKATQLANVEKAVMKCGRMAQRLITAAEKQAKSAEKDAKESGGDAEIRFTPGDLKDLVSALKGVSDLMRDLFDLPNEQQRIQREKLNIEREKLKMIKDAGGSVEIQLRGADEEEAKAWSE